MNFLMRTTSVSIEQVSVPESHADIHHGSTTGSILETLVSDDPYTRYSTIEKCNGETDEVGDENGSITFRTRSSRKTKIMLQIYSPCIHFSKELAITHAWRFGHQYVASGRGNISPLTAMRFSINKTTMTNFFFHIKL